MSCHRPFYRTAALVAPAVAALVLLTPASMLSARAQGAQAAQGPEQTTDGAKSNSAKPTASQTTGARGAGNVAAVDQANPSPQKSLTSKAIDRGNEGAKPASDIFNRVPGLPPQGGAESVG